MIRDGGSGPSIRFGALEEVASDEVMVRGPSAFQHRLVGGFLKERVSEAVSHVRRLSFRDKYISADEALEG